jgi:hypothetical protein
MFARKATFRAIDWVRNIAQVRLVHSNDNLVYPPASTLVCHWHIAPATGKPEAARRQARRILSTGCRWLLLVPRQ